MRRGAVLQRSTILVVAGASCLAALACRSPGEWARLVKENQSLREDKARLERSVSDRDGTITSLHLQIDNLKGFGADRPTDAFAPIKLEIASLSGGANYDGQPGDDGVTVYLRPLDADGDVVKASGRIAIQLLDNSVLGSPRVVGVYVFDDIKALRKMWYGMLGTQHYTVRCPFPPGATLPESRKLLVSAAFVDFLTGQTLTADKEIAFATPVR
ncbi:MAG: hypothetical protein AAB341_02350 [Planctomycetota bacterium]